MSTTETTALTTTPTPTTRHDGWTPERQATFLRTLTATHCVTQAARSVGMSRQSAYKLRARLKGEPFDLAWGAAMQCRFDALAEAAMERALNGVEHPHFYRGELVHTSRKFDERLTVALLAMRDSFRPARVPAYEPASEYLGDGAGGAGGQFARLVNRVEEGPETWAEEVRLRYEDYYGPDQCPACGSQEDCDCPEEEGEE